MALGCLLALPVVIFAAGAVQIWVVDVTWRPGVPHAFGMVSGSLPAFLTSVLIYMLIRLGCEGSAPGVPLARWPVRLAPIVLLAVWLTWVGMGRLWAAGAVNGLVVLPALTLWGATGGEWVAHRWLARGQDASGLVSRFFFFAAGGVAWLMIAGWFLHSPRAELERAREKCDASYADARTAADSATIHAFRPVVAGETWTSPCAALRPR